MIVLTSFLAEICAIIGHESLLGPCKLPYFCSCCDAVSSTVLKNKFSSERQTRRVSYNTREGVTQACHSV